MSEVKPVSSVGPHRSAEEELHILLGRLGKAAVKSKELSSLFREVAISNFIKHKEHEIAVDKQMGRVYMHLGKIGILGVSTVFAVTPNGMGALCEKLGSKFPWLNGFIQNKGEKDYQALANKVIKICKLGTNAADAGIEIERNFSNATRVKNQYQSDLGKILSDELEKKGQDCRTQREEARDILDKWQHQLLQTQQGLCR
jgi:hypothetical protein